MSNCGHLFEISLVITRQHLKLLCKLVVGTACVLWVSQAEYNLVLDCTIFALVDIIKELRPEGGGGGRGVKNALF